MNRSLRDGLKVLEMRGIVEAAGIEPAQDSPRRRCIGCPSEINLVRVFLRRTGRHWICEACIATKAEYVYLVRDGKGRAKIGHARDPIRRLASLQIGSADELELVGCIPGTRKVEQELHDLFATQRLRGEWFFETAELLAYFTGEVA